MRFFIGLVRAPALGVLGRSEASGTGGSAGEGGGGGVCDYGGLAEDRTAWSEGECLDCASRVAVATAASSPSILALASHPAASATSGIGAMRPNREVVMGYFVRFGVVTSLAALLTLSASIASAQAEGDSMVVSPGELEVAPRSELQSHLADLEAAYQIANVRKPRAGVAVSVLVITGGVAALMAGVVLESDFGGGSPSGGPLIGVGSATIAVGAGGLAFSGVRLKRAKRERRRLESEIESLRSALDSGTEQR